MLSLLCQANKKQKIEGQASALIAQIEREGGMVRAIESGWVHAQIAEAAWA